MRIVYITNASFLDHSYTIAKELKKNNEVYVFIQAKEQYEEIRSWCNNLNAAFVKRKRYRNPLSLFSEYKFMLLIRKLKADRIWFNGITIYQAALAKILLKNFFVMVHDVESHFGSKDYFSLVTSKLYLVFFKKRIGTASITQASILEKNYGVSPKVFQLPIIDYYSNAGIPAKPAVMDTKNVRFFFFGSIYPYKGIEILIDALEILNNGGLKFSFSIFGRLKYNNQSLKNKIDELKFVKFTDKYIDYKDVHKIYCRNDVLILPYRQVTQCGPLLIGYNELIPSICSDLPGFREYVDDGKSGLLFSSRAEGLAEKMEMLIKNPGEILEMKKYIKAEIFQKFSVEKLYTRYISTITNF